MSSRYKKQGDVADQVDIAKITATNDAIVDVNFTLNTISVAGDKRDKGTRKKNVIGYRAQDEITIVGGANAGDNTIVSVAYDDMDTILTLKEPLVSDVVAGNVTYKAKAYVIDGFFPYENVAVQGDFSGVAYSVPADAILSYWESNDGVEYFALAGTDLLASGTSTKLRKFTAINMQFFKIKFEVKSAVLGTYSIYITAR